MISETEITLQFQKRLKRLSVYLAGGAIAIGALALVGWQFNIAFFKTIIPGLAAINPASAICFVLSGGAILIIHRHPPGMAFVWKLFALLVLFTGLSCMITTGFGFTGGIDRLFFTQKLDLNRTMPNHMAPNTAFNFTITGLSLLLFGYEARPMHKAAQYLMLVTALVSLLSIIGYLYGVKAFYGVLTYIPMAIHSSFGFLLVSGAILLSSCDKGIVASFTGHYAGSVLARKLVPAIILVPVLLGFITISGERSGLYVNQFGAALFTGANILIFAWLIKKIQSSVNKADVARSAAESKLMEANAQLEKRSAALETANKELETFSYSISHDLKAPLRYITGFTKILQEDYGDKLDEEGRHVTNVIVKNTGKMAQLIDDLLEFARIRRQEMHNARCDMRQLVNTALKDQESILEKNHHDIQIGELPSCQGDPRMIQQVWLNLISNAIKYSHKKEKPVVEIGSYRQNGQTVYYVKDNGAGFEMIYAHKLFNVFQRLHSEREFEGTGIGLSIVHGIVTRHGGTVWADAKLNEGAAFYFTLPGQPE